MTTPNGEEAAGNISNDLFGSQNPPSLPIYSSFEELLTYFELNGKGSYYERENGLKPRHYKGVKHSEDFGTITYVTDDARIALIWAFGCRAGWFYVYPSDAQFMYFLKQAPDHIRRVLENNNKGYKLK